MGFGVLLASGDRNELFPDELLDCLTEVRVEQSLDEPARFAVRFEDDLENGEPRLLKVPQLQPETVVTVAAPTGRDGEPPACVCLARGPITEIKCSLVLGGPGSWVEIRGQDRRVELDRQCFRHVWSGRASDAAAAILSGYGFTADVEETSKVYGERTGTLNQRATDLEFVRRIGRLNNLHFWITYSCRLDGLDPRRRTLKVEETAHLKASPPRPRSLGGLPLPPGEIPLVPTVTVALKVNVGDGSDRPGVPCPNVTAFDLDVDVERPNAVESSALNDRDLKEDGVAPDDPQPSLSDRTLADVTGRKRQVCLVSAGDAEEVQPRAEAALTDAGWYIRATASTTAHMLGDVVEPHDVIDVQGLGSDHSGAYQVQSVTHVIQAADHLMDLELRRR